ncbi:hypothetical protein, variant [Aphanomyces invadans]|uniref:Uncharacterized protein n=1 Tax=Aphanomyces invadans TaxID=157072 RepID=A0A024UC65_9STRA|nr:hypothetical protein H310_05632 [Aphanomyces invadans]XP_008868617.1 hypothetical protein, variant [Aphanomyces invadans]ETW03232.1 hypothetical protein H310_05632 [Aphanomyces invadans]ETW03233.1 hypothetical protein, variant [Aphanomyces invadans]|eukprot:XP_008868616.1 hypothetical protein H310_05632 [Aphanomyces invadans]
MTFQMNMGATMAAAIILLLPHASSHKYPAYCAKDMSLSAIQPLERSLASSVELVQVQIVVRHGARAPCFPDVCWKDYNEEWNCNMRELSRPVLSDFDGSHDKSTYNLEFAKVFTGGRNIRRGNCSVGQLIDEGFHQELQNAKHFRDAYVTAERGLFAPNEAVDVTDATDVRFESSDVPRTLQSGQTIVQGMFPTVAYPKQPVPWHTQDKAVSIIFPNEANCPALASVAADWLSSSELHEWRMEPPNVDLDWALEEALASYSSNSLFDCLMTSKCTNRPLPLSDELFHLAAKREEAVAIMQYVFRDSIYSKIAMKEFLQAVMSRFVAATIPNQRHLRLALYAAHDSSLMALLAALGGTAWLTEWVPYASHLIFELYQSKSSPDAAHRFFVRVLYQGQPVLLGRCTNELCPVGELVALVDEMPSCDVPTTSNHSVPAVKHVPMMLMLVSGLAVGGGIGFIVARRALGSLGYTYQRLD